MRTIHAFKSQEDKKKILRAYDTFLKEWNMPYKEIYTDTRYGKTCMITCGDEKNPPLILLHGTGMNSVMWLKDMKEFAKEYRVYAIDIVGEPGRSDERQLPLRGTFYAEWLNEVMKAQNISKAILIGISLGAWLAVKFAVNYPEKAEKLILISPSGIGPQRKAFIFTALGYGLLGEKGIEKLYCKVNGNRPLPAGILQYQMLIRKSFQYRRETIPLFSDEELGKLTMPIVLFAGVKDIMLHSEKTAKRLKELLPHAAINILPEEGHSIVNLSEKIKGFL